MENDIEYKKIVDPWSIEDKTERRKAFRQIVCNTDTAVTYFAQLEKEGYTVHHQMSRFCNIAQESVEVCYSDELDNFAHEVQTKVFTKYLKEKRTECINAFKSAFSVDRWFGICVMAENPDENKQDILYFAQDKSKLVSNKLLEILYKQKAWEEDIKKLLFDRKADARELAIKVLTKWQNDGADYGCLFAQAIKNEKSTKLVVMLADALFAENGKAARTGAFTHSDLVQQLHKGNKKSLLSWAYETPFSTVHTTNGEEAGEEYLQSILLCYALAENNGVSNSAASLAQDLNAYELAIYINELFDKWLDAGAEMKSCWVLYASAIHGGHMIVERIKRKMSEMEKKSGADIASEAVKALVFNPTPPALMMVENISRKYKYKKVMAAAGEAMGLAASKSGITREELADRIIPDFSFDENMERIFDYGGRQFRATLTIALEIEVFDESGRKIKNLPKAGKNDDPEKASATYEEFKLMKNQIKTVINNQIIRLESAFLTKREWSIEAWKTLFVNNPIMHPFAISLIWGAYKDGGLIQSFRYMEDGSFNTEDEKEYILPENDKTQKIQIGLVHPMELGDSSLSKWVQQLEDYEIAQPIEQLKIPAYKLNDEEKTLKSLERFKGYALSGFSLSTRLMAMGWHRGAVQDEDGFNICYCEDKDVGLGVELRFSDGIDEDANVELYDVRFYKADMVERGRYMYNVVSKERAIALEDVPPRYFSKIISQITDAAASSQKTNRD